MSSDIGGLKVIRISGKSWFSGDCRCVFRDIPDILLFLRNRLCLIDRSYKTNRRPQYFIPSCPNMFMITKNKHFWKIFSQTWFSRGFLKPRCSGLTVLSILTNLRNLDFKIHHENYVWEYIFSKCLFLVIINMFGRLEMKYRDRGLVWYGRSIKHKRFRRFLQIHWFYMVHEIW